MPLEQAYADSPVYTKTDGRGASISAASQPRIVAMMLEQLDARPGHRVMEAGAGTGYNAALLAAIVGDTGRVVTIDVDDDLVEGARKHLAAAGVAKSTSCTVTAPANLSLPAGNLDMFTLTSHDSPRDYCPFHRSDQRFSALRTAEQSRFGCHPIRFRHPAPAFRAAPCPTPDRTVPSAGPHPSVSPGARTTEEPQPASSGPPP
ncbi:methyltransferase domain-containing protein [Micromonospora sp. BQ11]|uniref:methyltransferase domain-containing protein n=1 Tax=Micromonospora sp. BQ11 TaxID=3452212 RepID=UPI003F8A8278